MPSLLNTAIHLVESTPARWTLIEPINSVFDCMFYDWREVFPIEWMKSLIPVIDPKITEGSVLIVSPGQSSQVFDLRDDHEIRNVLGQLSQTHAVTISGCGSSYLGSVAFGRAVAKLLNGPVASIVTGYGVRDALTEVASGMMFADVNWGLHFVDSLMNPVFGQGFWWRPVRNEVYDWANISSEAWALETLLLADSTGSGKQIKKIIGHSKGNYAVAAALFGFKASIQDDPVPEILDKTDIDVYTFGCWVELPHDNNGNPFGNFRYHQYVGQIDPLQINSPLDKLAHMYWDQLRHPWSAQQPTPGSRRDEHMVPAAGHHVADPWHMPIKLHMPIERILQ